MIASMIASLGPWNWWILGFVLLAAELAAPGVFLIWIGLAALVMGTASLFLWEQAFWSWQIQLLLFAGLSVIITLSIFGIFALDYRQAHVVPAPIIYVESWPKNRTDAEIQRQQKIDAAALHAAQKARQEQFKKIARAFGME